MKKIGVFGGTFDPIHLGHLAIAKAARSQFNLDKVLFIPACIPPHKADRIDLTLASHRYEMVCLATKDTREFEVSDLELKRGSVSYTFETLRELRNLYRESELFFIIGSDSLSQIGHWKNVEEIFKLATLLVVKREGHPIQDKHLGRMNEICMESCQIASSEIREKFLSDRESSLKMVPELVSKYIVENNLYKETKGIK